MSYFCAKAIKIDKLEKTFQVRGGDNNVIPRMDYWSGSIELKNLLTELSSGNVQFTTRTDKHLAIRELVNKYERILEDLTGLSVYELGAHISGRLDPEKMYDSIKYYTESKFSGDYAQRQIALINRKVEIWQDAELMQQINSIVDAFVTELVDLKITKPQFVIRRKWDGVFVKRVNRYSISFTRSIDTAKRMTEFSAESVLRGYDSEKYEIVKAGA